MGDVRARTLSRMQQLMKAAAGVAVVSAAGCPPGYMVVDPVPPPSRCAGNPPDIKASATLLENVNGEFEVFIIFERSAKPASYVDQAPTVEGGSLIFWRVTAAGFELRLKLPPQTIAKQTTFATPPAGAPSLDAPTSPSTAPTHRLTATLPLVCSDGAGALTATVDIHTDGKTGDKLQVNLTSN